MSVSVVSGRCGPCCSKEPSGKSTTLLASFSFLTSGHDKFSSSISERQTEGKNASRQLRVLDQRRWLQDRFLLERTSCRINAAFRLPFGLPHKCGGAASFGTPHLCGSEEFCSAPGAGRRRRLRVPQTSKRLQHILGQNVP